MKADNVNISQDKIALIEWIAQLQDSTIINKLKRLKADNSNGFKQDVKSDLEEAFRDIKLHQEGKIELGNLEEFLNEL